MLNSNWEPRAESTMLEKVLALSQFFVGNLILVVVYLAVVTGFMWLLKIVHVPESILSYICGILTGVLVFTYAVKFLLGYFPHPAIASTASFSTHTYTGLLSFGAGMIFAYHLNLAISLGLVGGIVVQGYVFRSLISGRGHVLGWRKASLIALLMILGDFIISSPIVALVLGEFTKA